MPVTKLFLTTNFNSLNEDAIYIVHDNDELSTDNLDILSNFIKFNYKTKLFKLNNYQTIIEIGPRFDMITPFSTNATIILNNLGMNVKRIERSHRKIIDKDSIKINNYDKLLQEIYNNDDNINKQKMEYIFLNQNTYNDIHNNINKFNFDKDELEYYNKMFEKRGYPGNNLEYYDLLQSNSEHSRHWFFKGILRLNNNIIPDLNDKSLFDLLKEPLTNKPNDNSLIAFSDNSSVIKGTQINYFYPNYNQHQHQYQLQEKLYDICLTAETHNFPTGIEPFSGAATGVGGRIRDIQACGRGAIPIAGLVGYCVGDLFGKKYDFPYPKNIAKPTEILIKASNGASDYGNKFGEPQIGGFTRSFVMITHNHIDNINLIERREWVKPIMFSAGIGMINHDHINKSVNENNLIVKIGGPVYRIGIGGGSASSCDQTDNVTDFELNAVQRGDPEMEQKMNRFIRTCTELDINPIKSIHDQGAGGNGNVLKEIVNPLGGIIYLDKFTLGQSNLTPMEIWSAEYQESNALIIDSKDKNLLKTIAKRERVPIDFIGHIKTTGKIELFENSTSTSTSTPTPLLSLDLDDTVESIPRKTFNLSRVYFNNSKCDFSTDISTISSTIWNSLTNIFTNISVGSKRFLTNKVDRSVSGLIAQQQCVGPFETPLSNVAVVAHSFFNTTGTASAIGEQPIKAFLNPAAMARLSIGEMLTNIIWASITCLEDIKCSVNWMWPAKHPNEGILIYDAVQSLVDQMKKLGIALDGGKDSLSMSARINKNDIKAPRSMVVTGYVICDNIRLTITPDLKMEDSTILYIDLGMGKYRMGGSIFYQENKQLGDESPDFDFPHPLFKKIFKLIQYLIKNKIILSGHDRSDGGLLTTLLEMSISGNIGLNIDLSNLNLNLNHNNFIIPICFSEELGFVLETPTSNVNIIMEMFNSINNNYNNSLFIDNENENDYHIDNYIYNIGTTSSQKNITIKYHNLVLLDKKISTIRDLWEYTSFKLELLQTNINCVNSEISNLNSRNNPIFNLNPILYDFTNSNTFSLPLSNPNPNPKPKPGVIILREEGSNGDKEMAAAFYSVGFNVFDINMNDLCNNNNKININNPNFNVLALVGGFSYGDTFGAGVGWANCLLKSPILYEQIKTFFNRNDTLSIGICNGCQTLALMNDIIKWIPYSNSSNSSNSIKFKFAENNSNRFESRFTNVKILPNNTVWLKDMENSNIPVWSAHKEGRLEINKNDLEYLNSNNLLPIRYVNDYSQITEIYPYNPNGSPLGVAGISSKCGRHLIMMPHPERSFIDWQLAYNPYKWKNSPWLKMFKNAYDFFN
jgi:phosphoribosylformylglycinamidine synthase